MLLGVSSGGRTARVSPQQAWCRSHSGLGFHQSAYGFETAHGSLDGNGIDQPARQVVARVGIGFEPNECAAIPLGERLPPSGAFLDPEQPCMQWQGIRLCPHLESQAAIDASTQMGAGDELPVLHRPGRRQAGIDQIIVGTRSGQHPDFTALGQPLLMAHRVAQYRDQRARIGIHAHLQT